MHIASFAGFAPVNNPVIAVAVVIDSPKGAYYGAEVSAPVFAEVAQQVLEYLGVQHDIDLRPADSRQRKSHPSMKTIAPAQGENIQALYDAANDLPSDDPLRAAPAAQATAPAPPPFFAATNSPHTREGRCSSSPAPTASAGTSQQPSNLPPAAPNPSSSPTPGEFVSLPSSACLCAR